METGANKILPKVNFSPSSLDNLLTEKCHLSVEVGLNKFAYCLFDTLSFTYILLKEFKFEARGISEFQRIVNRTITPQLLKWKGVEATQEIAKSTNSKVIVIGNGDGDLPIILGGQ